MTKIIEKVIEYFYSAKDSKLREITLDEYREHFISNRSSDEIKATYEKAWAAKNFEIDNYWKRTTYFWAFQVASFAGYFTVFNSDFYKKNTEVLYCVICVGFITALAWSLINRGSKSWQRNWENHVDMLEDCVTGPLYKTVSVSNTFSVSKINEIVSNCITTIWILLGFKFLIENITLDPINNSGIKWIVLFSSIAVIYFSGAMIVGHGRGRFGKRDVVFLRRGE